jgi:PAS domain-containing protein
MEASSMSFHSLSKGRAKAIYSDLSISPCAAVILSVTRIRDIRLFVIELRDFVGLYMDTSPSAVAAREADLWSAAFDFSAEPLLLLDPHGDRIIDGNRAACALLGYDRALLRK